MQHSSFSCVFSKILFGIALATSLMFATPSGCAQELPSHRPIPILVYHRFADTVDDPMTVRLDNFRSHLRAIRHAGFRVVPLADVLVWYRGEPNALPERSVAITIDDGHRSVFEALRPMLRAMPSPVPVTVFVYPSAISNASYAMTWDELISMKKDGNFSIESHTYWHPNFRSERAKRDGADYQSFVLDQFKRARTIIASKTGTPPTLLAWPFGIHDAELEGLATKAGYVAAFTIEARPVSRSESIMALPRYLITDQCGEECIWEILRGTESQHD
ncbi:polysaccharide deacetylase family protein [Cupriavidus pauculus]|uniref:polysaccharide deacetylase family protein n=1 Tax=Cupriavidus pauculus TaxID=82633 RepID=UPI0007857D08|nr:polysaccharide deacetylase family protein [Cupriavidus pauculus]